MGRNFSSMFGEIVTKKEFRFLLLGLDAAGKTTILYQLRLGEVVTTIPTIGFNVESIDAKKSKCTIWDVGGMNKIRPLWRHYLPNTEGLIFVVDLNDKERMEEAGKQLHNLLQNKELTNVPLLVFGNKKDLPNAISLPEMVEKLSLNKIRQREWYAQCCCAITGQGIEDGLQWLNIKCAKK